MEYCPPNETFTQLWVNHGAPQCPLETISTSVIFSFIILGGSIQLLIYKRYASLVIGGVSSLPSSKLYKTQVSLVLTFPILVLAKFILQGAIFEPKTYYGYMVLCSIFSVIMYPFSYWIMYKERYYQLPTVPAKGHGFVLLLFWSLGLIAENLAIINARKRDWWFNVDSLSHKVQMGLFVLTYLWSLSIFVLGLRAPGILTIRDYLNLSGSQTNLINGEDPEQAMSSGSTWRNLWKKTQILAPFLWPKKDFLLQLSVIFCFVLLLAGRIINLYVPIYSKLIVDSMSIEPITFRWDLVLIYVFFKFLQGGGTGGMGVLNNLRTLLWVKIQQYTSREVELKIFQHIHSLSLRWHLSRKTGEVIRVMDRGTDSINNLLNYILFQIIPCIIDIVVAVVYFVSYFNVYFGIIVFITMVLYLVVTVTVTEWRTKYQRSMNLADNAAKATCTDSLLNYETVKYYCAEDYEYDRYRQALLAYQKEEFQSMLTLNILNTLQNILITGGLLAGSLLCVHMVVVHHTLSVGDYVLFSGYILQLYVPLNWFGTYYRMIQKNFVDMENMFDLMKEGRDVDDNPNAKQLEIKGGEIEFKNVTFHYVPERVILKNISFHVPAGKKLALVGASGSGKTTIVRLLFRFYDIQSGSILIDGQNIQLVKQKSLRQSIGIVPQDTVLFNASIKYNIQYGRLNAEEKDVTLAAKSGEIHDRILTFPNGYDTEVGERGLKLSGGEKQRVAISRTVLKAPTIILLDEATSALDTETERNIQASMDQLWGDRTMIIVAHRLSTITHADEILVMKEGEIVERGNHESLLAAYGLYCKMWEEQLKNRNQPNNENKNLQDKEETTQTNNVQSSVPFTHHHHH